MQTGGYSRPFPMVGRRGSVEGKVRKVWWVHVRQKVEPSFVAGVGITVARARSFTPVLFLFLADLLSFRLHSVSLHSRSILASLFVLLFPSLAALVLSSFHFRERYNRQCADPPYLSLFVTLHHFAFVVVFVVLLFRIFFRPFLSLSFSLSTYTPTLRSIFSSLVTPPELPHSCLSSDSACFTAHLPSQTNLSSYSYSSSSSSSQFCFSIFFFFLFFQSSTRSLSCNLPLLQLKRRHRLLSRLLQRLHQF